MSDSQSNPSLDDFTAQLIKDLEPWGRAQEKRLFAATVLDRDDRPLSSGRAILADGGVLGTFWPQAESPGDTNPKNAAALVASDGRQFAILASSGLCPCEFGLRHFHFDSLPISPCQMSAATMKVNARVQLATGQIAHAIFDSRDTGEGIALVLDRGAAPDKDTVYFYPKPGALKTESGKAVQTGESLPPLCNHLGPIIAIEKYLSLPAWRRGFVVSD